MRRIGDFQVEMAYFLQANGLRPAWIERDAYEPSPGESWQAPLRDMDLSLRLAEQRMASWRARNPGRKSLLTDEEIKNRKQQEAQIAANMASDREYRRQVARYRQQLRAERKREAHRNRFWIRKPTPGVVAPSTPEDDPPCDKSASFDQGAALVRQREHQARLEKVRAQVMKELAALT